MSVWKPHSLPADAKWLSTHYIQEPNSGCWIWTGALSYEGYGRVRWKGKTRYAHRISYQLYCGAIDPALELDHLCRVRCCVNPHHLEAVTRKVNYERGLAPIELNRGRREQTHCAAGSHPLFGSNLYTDSTGRRHCRECNKIAQRKRRSRKGVSA